MDTATTSLLARYNAWANARIYDAAARLADADYRADRGAFFGSVHRTLNHLLATDRIWMRRFTGVGDAPNRLDAILFEELPALRAAREAEDARIVAWVDGLLPEQLVARIRYTPISDPEPVVQPLWPALMHLFNHETHHRGQVHGLLTAIGGRDAAPSIDLMLFERESGIGMG